MHGLIALLLQVMSCGLLLLLSMQVTWFNGAASIYLSGGRGTEFGNWKEVDQSILLKIGNIICNLSLVPL